MAKPKAQTRREELEAEVKTCRRSRANAQRAHTEAKQRVSRLEARRRSLLVEAARREDVEDAITTAKREIAEAEADVRDADDRAQAAKRAGDGAERRLQAHLAANLAKFIIEADKLVDAAVSDRQAVLDAIERAKGSEELARREWNVLRRAARAVDKADLGTVPESAFDSKMVERIVNAPRPEPRNVARSRKRRLGIPNLPEAVRALFKGPEPQGDWTPIPAKGKELI